MNSDPMSPEAIRARRAYQSELMGDPQNYKADFDDDGTWFVASPDGRRIDCGDRMSATLTLACIYEATDPRAEFERMLAEVLERTEAAS